MYYNVLLLLTDVGDKIVDDKIAMPIKDLAAFINLFLINILKNVNKMKKF